MSKHKDEDCREPFCQECLNKIKRVADQAKSLHEGPTKDSAELRERLIQMIASYLLEWNDITVGESEDQARVLLEAHTAAQVAAALAKYKQEQEK